MLTRLYRGKVMTSRPRIKIDEAYNPNPNHTRNFVVRRPTIGPTPCQMTLGTRLMH